MKLNIFKKNNFFKLGIASLFLSFLFFLISIFSLSFTDYKLSNYSKELKERFNLDYQTLFNFDYWFASYYDYTNASIPINNIDKLIIQSPNTNVYLHYDESNTISYTYDVRMNISNSINNLAEYKYLPNTRTGVLTINDSSSSIYESNLYLNIPSSFKKNVVVKAFKENIFSSIKTLVIEEPKNSNKK